MYHWGIQTEAILPACIAAKKSGWPLLPPGAGTAILSSLTILIASWSALTFASEFMISLPLWSYTPPPASSIRLRTGMTPVMSIAEKLTSGFAAWTFLPAAM